MTSNGDLHEAVSALSRDFSVFRAEVCGALGAIRTGLERLQESSIVVQSTVGQLNDRSIATGVRQEDHTTRIAGLERDVRSNSRGWSRITGIYVGVAATLALLASVLGFWMRFAK